MKKGYSEDTGGVIHTMDAGNSSPKKRRFHVRAALAAAMAAVLVLGLMIGSAMGAETAPVSVEDKEVSAQSGQTEEGNASDQLNDIADQFEGILEKEKEEKGTAEAEIQNAAEVADASQFSSDSQYSSVAGGDLNSVPFTMIGTTSGNLYNKGEFAFYEDKVLYVDNGNLMMAGPGMQSPAVICQGVYGNLNMVGNVCVYTALDMTTVAACLVDDTTASPGVLFSLDEQHKPKRMCVVGSWIYFATDRGLYRVPISDTSTAYLVSDVVNTSSMSMCAINGKLVCSGSDGTVLMMEPDGSNITRISNLKGGFVSDGNAIYLSTTDQRKLYRITIEGSNVQETILMDLNEISDKYDFHIYSMNYADGWIYQVWTYEDVYFLARMNTEGTEVSIVDAICDQSNALYSMGANDGSDFVYFFTITKNGENYVENHFPMDIKNVD